MAPYALTVMHATRAMDGWTRLGRYREALEDWDKALRADPGKVRDVLLVGRAFTRAHQGQHAAADKEADAALKAPTASAEAQWMGGRVYALAAAAAAKDAALPADRRAKVAEAYAARAVVLLRSGIDRGLTIFKDETRPASLRRDPDFTALQGRADFQQLLVALEGKEPRPKE
jgi:tetratricopeptide (TPR) repeat protein